MERDKSGVADELRPAAVDNFRAVLSALRDSYNATDLKSARAARRNARRLGTEVVRSFKESPIGDQFTLKDVVTRTTLLVPGDDLRDLYYILLSTKQAPATVVRDLLGIRPHGSLPRSKRLGIY